MSDLHYAQLLLAPARIGDPYALHQCLWKAFAGSAEERPFLHRADRVQAPEGPRLKVLVQSVIPGDWTAIGATVIERKEVARAPTFTAGERRRFLLRANVTVQRKGQHEFAGLDREAFRAARGRRVALWEPAGIEEWIVRKLDAAGARIPTETLRNDLDEPVEQRAVRHSNARPWRWTRKDNPARHDGVDFEGVLEVVDPTRLRESLVLGIGPAKAFGFGLLSLAPLPATP